MGRVDTMTTRDSTYENREPIRFPNLAGLGRQEKKKKNQGNGDEVQNDATVAAGSVPGRSGQGWKNVNTADLYKNLKPGDEQGGQP